MKTLNTFLVAVLTAGVGLAHAEDSPHSVSANVAIVTDYVFRGISQTNEDPAIQGGFDYGFDFSEPAAFYAGVWASNVEFNENAGVAIPFNEATIEIDFYGGFNGQIMGADWDVGGLYYFYPSSPGTLSFDYGEAYGSLGYAFGPVDAKAGLNYSPDYYGAAGDATWLYGELATSALPAGFGLSFQLARQWIQKNLTFGTPDYNTWSVGISQSPGHFWEKLSFMTLELKYIDTDLSSTECFGGGTLCEGRVVFMVSGSI
ncbi:MAG: TorF family putative porin [Gammaproteobacteria bacterium]